MDDAIWDTKRALRRELREGRRTRDSMSRDADSVAITEHLVALATQLGASSVSCYLSGEREPNTRPFLNWAHAASIRVLLPVAREDGLLDWVVSDGVSETEGLFGLPEGVGDVQPPMAIASVDLIVAPALAVDRMGNRLGQGRGYYDKVLGSMTSCPPVFGVVFDNEFVDAVPAAPVDRRVDGVVTPSGGAVTFSRR